MKISIDVMDLSKGDVISTQEIMDISGRVPGTNRFNVAAMEIRKFLEAEFKKKRNMIVTVEFVKDTLVIHTDDNAISYNDDRFRSGVKVLRSSQYRQKGVDLNAVTTQEKKDKLLRSLTINGAIVSAMTSEKRKQERFQKAMSASVLSS